MVGSAVAATAAETLTRKHHIPQSTDGTVPEENEPDDA
jgi:hypothetical protein